MDRKFKFQELTKQYFWFLVDRYGLKYREDENAFFSDAVNVYVQDLDFFVPQIELWLRSEPEFSRQSLDSLVSEFIDFQEIDIGLTGTLEENFAFLSRIFQTHAHKLIFELDKLLLPALKNSFQNSCKSQKRTPDEFIRESSYNKRFYDYIRRKDPDWDPRIG